MTRYQPNPAGMRELQTRPKTGEAMEKIAGQILARVVQNGGRFTKGYKVERVTVDGSAGARVGTDFPMAHWDEWGNRFRAPRAPMRRALSSLGLLGKTQEKGKP